MIAAAVSLALLSGLWPHHPPATGARPQRIVEHVGSWTYEVTADAFTGQRRCKLYGRDARSGVSLSLVGGSGLAFRLGHHLETADAVYRVDGGQPRWSRDDRTSLILANVVLPSMELNQNQATGLVVIPVSVLSGAHQVFIRTDPRRAPITVRLSGLDQVIAATNDRGCTPGSFAQLALSE